MEFMLHLLTNNSYLACFYTTRFNSFSFQLVEFFL